MRTFIMALVHCLMCITLLGGNVVFGGERVERVTGTGLTRDEALANGLEEAVRRVSGATIKSERTLESEAAEASVRINGKDHDRISYSATQSGNTRIRTKGLVSSYEVLSEQRDADGRFRLEMRVHLATYETPGFSPHSRRKIAVLPLRTDFSGFDLAGQRIPGERVSDRLAHHLVNHLTQSRRFSVIDRMYTAEYLRERDFLRGGDVPLKEYVRLGQALGVDYLVVGRIVDAGGDHAHKHLISGEIIDRGGVFLRVDYRVLVMATRQIKWASTVEVTEPWGRIDGERAMELATEAAAGRISHEMLDNIYPVTVAAVTQNGQVVLNQGGNGLSVGEQLIVYRLGKRIRDPYTNESLGRTEQEVGRVEIVRVQAKTAYAELLDGGSAMVGDLCRTAFAGGQADVPEPVPAAADIPKTDGGGVLLPFDR